ncbi:hypothetical protein AGMMS49975_29670 [Clostridia bacterium]|nr:hypothetical protein AGMMS49975_29670 [Clostridia bacterium]
MSKKASTALQTPIEEILKVEDNRVSAKVLYEFLELRSADYSRWTKTQIIENAFAEENVDFIPFRINAECGGQATTDYLLSVPFAKKLCMLSKSDKGEQARNYFIKCEATLKTLEAVGVDTNPLSHIEIVDDTAAAPAQLPASATLTPDVIQTFAHQYLVEQAKKLPADILRQIKDAHTGLSSATIDNRTRVTIGNKEYCVVDFGIHAHAWKTLCDAEKWIKQLKA